jgi:RimJ/RimL family protein N-acetyltransferase
VIGTPRLELRPLTDDEAEAVLAGRRDGRAWSDGYPTPGDVETAGWPAPADERWRTLQVVELATGLVIGAIGCHGAPEDGIVEIGYGIAPEARGRGLATEALAALVAFLEAQPEVRTLRAATDADNLPSQRVLERCGFVAVARDEALIAWRREGRSRSASG